ncbi:hypothetical protein COSO111634_29130 [Corallococcus soli]
MRPAPGSVPSPPRMTTSVPSAASSTRSADTQVRATGGRPTTPQAFTFVASTPVSAATGKRTSCQPDGRWPRPAGRMASRPSVSTTTTRMSTISSSVGGRSKRRPMTSAEALKVEPSERATVVRSNGVGSVRRSATWPRLRTTKGSVSAS